MVFLKIEFFYIRVSKKPWHSGRKYALTISMYFLLAGFLYPGFFVIDSFLKFLYVANFIHYKRFTSL